MCCDGIELREVRVLLAEALRYSNINLLRTRPRKPQFYNQILYGSTADVYANDLDHSSKQRLFPDGSMISQSTQSETELRFP